MWFALYIILVYLLIVLLLTGLRIIPVFFIVNGRHRFIYSICGTHHSNKNYVRYLKFRLVFNNICCLKYFIDSIFYLDM
jgi:hypothetical protein